MVGGTAYPPRGERLERLHRRLAGGLGGGCTLGGCRIVPRRGGGLVCREPAAAAPPRRAPPGGGGMGRPPLPPAARPPAPAGPTRGARRWNESGGFLPPGA